MVIPSLDSIDPFDLTRAQIIAVDSGSGGTNTSGRIGGFTPVRGADKVLVKKWVMQSVTEPPSD